MAKSFYGAQLDDNGLAGYRPTPVVEPVDDETLLVNTVVPVRFEKPLTGRCLVKQMEDSDV